MTTRSIRVPDDACCLDCGYSFFDLTSDTCPECGRAYDSADSSTYFTRNSRRSWRTGARPPSSVDALIVFASTVYVLNDVSSPGAPSPGVWFYFVIAGIWLYHLFDCIRRHEACRRDAPRAARDRKPRRRTRWQWFVGPACVVLLLPVFLRSDWPLRARFALSRRAFEAVQQDFAAGKPIKPGWRRVGLYYVFVSKWGDGHLGFRTVADVDGCGFVKAREDGDYFRIRQHLDDNWSIMSYTRSM